MKKIEFKLKKQYHEVFSLEPNDLGQSSLTQLYKSFTSPLKKMPFYIIVPLALLSAVLLYVLFGQLIVKLASLLQYGF